MTQDVLYPYADLTTDEIVERLTKAHHMLFERVVEDVPSPLTLAIKHIRVLQEKVDRYSKALNDIAEAQGAQPPCTE